MTEKRTIVLEWSDIWNSWFKHASDIERRRFLEDVDIISLVEMSDKDVQIEILKDAPHPLIVYLEDKLKVGAKFNLLGRL